MHAVTLVNGSHNLGLDALDRGLAYGDGVFETIALQQGQVQLWQGHCERLTKGLLRLGLAADAAAASVLVTKLISDIQVAYQRFQAPDGVLKITLTRGVGGRGYAAAVVPPSLVRPLRASQSPFPFALRLISIDPFFGLVGPYAAYGGRCQVPVVSSWKGLPRPFARWDARSGVGGVRWVNGIVGLGLARGRC